MTNQGMSKIANLRENSKIPSPPLPSSSSSSFFPKQYDPGEGVEGAFPGWSWGRNEVELVLKRQLSMGNQEKYISKNLPGEFPDSLNPACEIA